MLPTRRQLLVLVALTLAVTSLPAIAQVVTATVAAGGGPYAVAVNAGKIYVTNVCGDDPTCQSPGTVTVIDGATLSTQTVTVGFSPYALGVDSQANKIYVANECGNDVNCGSAGTVTVIDANNNYATTSVQVGYFPFSLAVNSTAHQIYATNECGSDSTCSSFGSVSVIDGGSNMVTATVPVQYFPEWIGLNPGNNKIYVANNCGNDITCNSVGTVSIIDGASNTVTATPNVGFYPYHLNVNGNTNQTYVSNYCGNDVTCGSLGTVSVIDGTSNNVTATVSVGAFPYVVAVNPTTNQIYVANSCGNDLSCSSIGTVTDIDANNNNTTTTIPVGYAPYVVRTDPAHNKVYVANYCGDDPNCLTPGTVTAIDPTSNNSTFPVAVGDGPNLFAINSSTNTIYIPNYFDGTVSVIGGSTELQFFPIPPCRLVDTRQQNGEFGGPSLQANSVRSFTVPDNQTCNIPASAPVYSLNVTVVPPPHGTLGYLTVWPTGEVQPNVSTLNSDGRVKANAAIVPAGVGSSISFYVTDTVDLVLDIDGYFAPANQSTFAFYPLPPCRVADTRDKSFPPLLGPPSLVGMMNRDFPVLMSNCSLPQTGVQAYSFNFTVVPPNGAPVGYLTVCPTPSDPNQPCPVVSTLNAYGGQVTANAAIVPAGTGGEIRTFPSDNTDLIIDINGYFAAPGQGGLSLYPTTPCRVLDTRLGNGAFNGILNPPVDVLGSPCGVPSQSQAYVFNATLVPQGPIGYLTLWPDGIPQPTISTLNAYDGALTSNMAIVPAGMTNGKVDAFAFPVNQNDPTDLTNLIMDISSFFAP